MTESLEDLKYFIAERNHILVLNFIGPLTNTSSLTLEKCIHEIGAKDAHFVIMSFRDVPPDLDRRILPTLTRLQKSIRMKPAQLLLCGIHPQLQKTLDSLGLLRPEELKDNLASALQYVSALGIGKIAA